VGRSGLLIALPDLPPEGGEPPECRRRGPVVALAYPPGAVPPREVAPAETSACSGVTADPVTFAPWRDEAAAFACSFPHNLAWGCAVVAPFSQGRALAFGFPSAQNTAAAAAGFAFFEDTLFAAVATTDGRVVGFVAAGGAEARRGLLGAGGGGGQGLSISVEPRSASEAVVTWMTGAAGSANRVVMDGAGAAVGRPERVPRSVALVASSRLDVARTGRADPHVVAGPAAGPLVPVGGLDPAAATFGPALAEAAPSVWLLAWSEGLRRETKIRIARFDPAARAVTGPIVDVSTAGREAGWAELDARAGHAVVLWSEKTGAGWEIRAAEIR
jgi:hypothetical protein